MNPGRLRHRVEIQEPITTSTNDHGEPVVTWRGIPHGVQQAEVIPLSALERIQGLQTQSDITHRVRMRYVPDVRSEMRVMHRGRVLEIVATLNVDERDTELEMICRERVPVE